MKRIFNLPAFLFIFSLSLAGCGGGGGGGGGGSSSVPPPSPPVSGGMASSTLIQAVRLAADGVVDLPVSDVYVTYSIPAIGSDVAGFTVQAETSGSALFVSVDPSTLTPVPVIGDVVSFTVTSKATVGSMARAATITGYSRKGGGASLSGLSQDVSASSDLVTALNSYESELVKVQSATITSSMSGSGSGFEAATIDTTGITGNSLLKLRIPVALQSIFGLESGCVISVIETPMWRFNSTAQITAWSQADISVTSCPAPTVTSAHAIATDKVQVVFSRAIKQSSISAPETQFTFNNGLSAVSGVVSTNTVDLTTSTQTSGTTYTLSVSNTVTDLIGTGVDQGFNTATFAGYAPAITTHLVINEVDYDNVGTDTNEFVEIYNPTANAIDLTGKGLYLINGSNSTNYNNYVDLSPAVSLPAGKYLVVGSTEFIKTLPSGTLSIAFSLASDNIQNGAPDGIVLVDDNAKLVIDALSYEGSITAATIPGFAGTVNLVEGIATSAADSNTVAGSLSRCPNGYETNNANNDWAFTSIMTPGASNSCP